MVRAQGRGWVRKMRKQLKTKSDGVPMENDTAVANALHETHWRGQCGGLSCRDNTQRALSPRYSNNTGQQYEQHY